MIILIISGKSHATKGQSGLVSIAHLPVEVHVASQMTIEEIMSEMCQSVTNRVTAQLGANRV
jgi:maltodextrin utilization protein YvdJ